MVRVFGSISYEAHDRAGLERLLRCCARPSFASERLTQVDAEQVTYRLPKLQPDGRTALSLTPLELLDRLAALIPPPRCHRHPRRSRAQVFAVTAWGVTERTSRSADTLPPPGIGFRVPWGTITASANCSCAVTVQRARNGRNLAELDHSLG